MKLRDQGFEAGDEVVFMRKTFEPVLTTVRRVISGTYSICIEGYSEWFTQTGQIAEAEPQRLFHRDAVTIDEHGRLIAIDHDYVKPRAPKVVKNEAHEFQPFERVVVRNRMVDPWKCGLYSHYDADWGKNLISLGIVDTEGDEGMGSHRCVGGIGYRFCVPFAGNEHLVGKVTV